MTPIDRRNFIKALAAAPAASVLTLPTHAQSGQPKARVVVIGGGYAGATAAKYVKLLDPKIEVTLVEPNKTYISCPLSNEVMVGHRDSERPLYGSPGAAFDMPKSAHIAMTQTKVAAAAIVAKLNGLPPPEPIYANICYSVVGDGYGISVAHLYRVQNGTFKYIKEGSGVSMMTLPDKSPVPPIYRKLEAEYTDGWIRNVLAEAFT